MEPDQGDRVFERAADLFSLLSTPTRLRIVCALLDGERNVSDLVDRLGVSQSNMSQHLGVLYRAGVLGRRRGGAQIFYRIDHDQVRQLCSAAMHSPSSAYGSPAEREHAVRPA